MMLGSSVNHGARIVVVSITFRSLVVAAYH
jgi:hypothetical protein